MTSKDGSVGIVKTQFAEIGDLRLESGEILPKVTLAYETYGKLSDTKDNAVLICHSLSGDAHAAGKHRANSKKYGWYDLAIGPGKPFDTNRFFVLCINIIGGCKGSTGPSSINPKTGKPYSLSFPEITVRDIVTAEKKLIDKLGVKKLFCVTGGSLGGMQAIQWALDYPDFVQTVIPIATAVRQHAMGLAFHEVGRQAIINDPDWKVGSYSSQPQKGLSLARQVGHITYLSHDLLNRKFGRNRTKNGKAKFSPRYAMQDYLRYKGRHFVGRFDANSYLYITWAIDNFDLTKNSSARLNKVFKETKAKFLVISFTSDWLYPPADSQDLVAGLAEAGVPVVYKNLDLPYGHDSFLVYNNTLGNVLQDFIEAEWREYIAEHELRCA